MGPDKLLITYKLPPSGKYYFPFNVHVLIKLINQIVNLQFFNTTKLNQAFGINHLIMKILTMTHSMIKVSFKSL